MKEILKNIKFDKNGLVPAVAQCAKTKQILMLAWMNKEAVEKTLTTKKVYYYSRSRKALWRKGESSGQTQKLKKFMIDCDNDAVLLLVEQKGVACHTGRESCFFNEVKGGKIKEAFKPKIDPKKLYGKKKK